MKIPASDRDYPFRHIRRPDGANGLFFAALFVFVAIVFAVSHKWGMFQTCLLLAIVSFIVGVLLDAAANCYDATVASYRAQAKMLQEIRKESDSAPVRDELPSSGN
ncbi:hypothetical protein KQI84_02185 [bacterium]|nr:hypothetical protein [bacterium]